MSTAPDNPSIPPDLRPADREELVLSVMYGLTHDGAGKRRRSADNVLVALAAEQLVRYLEKANYVILQGVAARAPVAPDYAAGYRKG